MNNTGLLALNGIPGSGKTLDGVLLAVNHYKSENRWYKYYISLFKYKVVNFIDSIDILKKILVIIKKIYNFEILGIKIVRVLFTLIYLFINLFLFLCLFVNFSIEFKIFVVLYLLYFKKIIKSFNKLDYEYYCMFPYKKINNVYSSFPILLDKKRNIWSNSCSLYDLDGSYSFYPNSLILIDEVQLFIDSDEYKDKKVSKRISKIAKFLQSHRHFGIKQIIFTSQSPTRIFKKARNIIIGYLKQNKIINLPFGISIMRGIIYYDFEYYGRYIPRDRQERRKLPFEYKKVMKIFFRNKVFTRYDSRYLSLYNYEQPLVNHGTWSTYKTDLEYLKTLFESEE